VDEPSPPPEPAIADVRKWHKTDVPRPPDNVRSWGGKADIKDAVSDFR